MISSVVAAAGSSVLLHVPATPLPPPTSSAVDDFEMDAPSFSEEGWNDDFCDSILSRFAGSDRESHQLLCAVVVAMSQELKEGNLPSSSDAYFGVACSFLDRIASEPNPQSHALDALLTVFSILVPRVPVAVLKDQTEFLLDLVVRVLRSPSPLESSVVSGIPSYERAQYLDFSVLLLPGLTDEGINELYQAIKPALQDAEGVVQKKAYRALSILLKSSYSFVCSKCEELSRLMVQILPSCHFSAKRHRIDCLYFLIVHVSKSKDNLEHVSGENVGRFLTEIIFAVKEANKKTRNRAYKFLVQIGHDLGDEEKGGSRENLHQIFKMIAVGLAGESPHMKSAAAKSLARLAYEFADLVLPAFNWLRSTYLIPSMQTREIIKAYLGLLKVVVVKSQAEWLQMHLQSVVESLFKWQNNSKNHFKAKAKLLLGMLVTKCGYGAVKAVIPEQHMKLLTNIHKIQERKARKRGAKYEENRSHFLKATFSAWNHTKKISDFDEDSHGRDSEYLNGITLSGGGDKSSLHLKSAASSPRSHMRLMKNFPEHALNESQDEPLDLLDRQRTMSALGSSEQLKRKSRSDDEVELDSEGRLIIREEWKRRNEKPAESEHDDRSEPDSHLSGKSGTKARKRRKTSDSGWAYTGKEYASKKAGGDLKRKDKLEPYAYWPLDRKMISWRPQQRAAARKGMVSVVKMTKKLEGKSASGVLSMKSLKLKGTRKKGGKFKKM